MGCGGSKKEPASAPVQAQVVNAESGGGGGGGGGRKKAPIKKDSKFQWKDGKGWSNYDGSSDARLKQAFLIGRPNAKCNINGEQYSFYFKKGSMSQMNVKTGKKRDMRPPYGMFPPSQAMLPPGDMIVITLTAEQAGKDTISIPNPREKGTQIMVSVPKKARKGQKIAVPIPAEGESVESVAQKQQAYNGGMSTGAKVAVGGTIVVAAGAGVVGGVILGDHLAGGTLAEQIGDGAVDAGEDIADFATGDFADWAADAGEDIGDFAEDVGEWLGDAGEDAGDWICSVFD